MILDESLFIMEDEIESPNKWTEVETKQVRDSDGFMTDYTWYTDGDEHICIFGDKDLYLPGEVTPDIDGFYGEAGAKAMSDWFNNYNGFEEDDEDMLTEAMSETIPSWLARKIKTDKSLKVKLNNRGYDLANLKFVTVPRNEIPTNGFHPLLKDPDKQLVYLLNDNRSNYVYLPTINDDDFGISLDRSDPAKLTPVKYLSKKQLLDNTVIMGYIEKSDPSNKTDELKAQRKDSKKGFIQRGKGQYQRQIKSYVDLPDGRTDWENPVYDYQWIMSKGQDKSGYPLNPTKYKDMLDSADMKTYGRQFERYTKKLEDLRSAIIDYVQKMSVTSGKGGWGSSITDVVRKFEEAIHDYKQLQEEIDSILKNTHLTDEEKNDWIQKTFDGTRSYNSISSLRRKLEDAWKVLSEVKKEDEQKVVEESLTTANFSEFKQIADEVGLTTAADLERFKKEEVDWENGEDELTAIKRYKQELIDAGVDLSQLVNEACTSTLEEGKVKEISMEVDETGGTSKYIEVLHKQLEAALSELHYLEEYAIREVGRGGAYDSESEIAEAVSELQTEIAELEAKLNLVSDAE